MKYQIHPALLLYAKVVESGRRLVAQTSESVPPLVIHDARVLYALNLLPATFDRSEALELWGHQDALRNIADELWNIGSSEGLLVSIDDLGARAELWCQYNWAEAYAYHEATRDYPFLQMDAPDAFRQDDNRMATYVAESPPPSIYLDVTARNRIQLQKIRTEKSLDASIETMPENERRGIEGLSLFFDICFGERKRVPFSVQGEFLRKSIPSGGARHPTEVFFGAFAGSPVPPGIYHYNVRDHCLDAVQEGDYFAEWEHATFDLFKKFKQHPWGVLVFASLWERAMWRYRDARSWRAPLIDVGHALMAYRTVSSVLGYGYYTYQKFRDKEICLLLNQDRLRLTPLFVGTLV